MTIRETLFAMMGVSIGLGAAQTDPWLEVVGVIITPILILLALRIIKRRELNPYEGFHKSEGD